MNHIGIKHINYYVPDQKISVDELLENIPDDKIPVSFSGKQEYASFIRNELKVDEIRVENTLKDFEMLAFTVEKLFIDEVIEPDEIDLILLAQEPGQRQKGHLAQYIQYEFEMNNAYIVNVSGNNCANIDYALTLASNVAKGNSEINNILILGNVKMEDPVKRLVGTYGLISDGSGAMLVSKGVTDLQLLDSAILSSGRFHHGALNQNDFLLLLKLYIQCIDNLLHKTVVSAENIQYVIIQNANPMLITQSLKHFGIDSSKIFSKNRSRYAHMDCLDFLVNLKDLMNLHPKNDRGYILSFGTGVAGSFISSLFSYDQ
jgi:3-oxoacyl-[acyl-carrier-protein] synthase III